MIAQYLNKKFDDEWKAKMFKSFDYQTSSMLDFLSTMNPEISDLEIIKVPPELKNPNIIQTQQLRSRYASVDIAQYCLSPIIFLFIITLNGDSTAT